MLRYGPRRQIPTGSCDFGERLLTREISCKKFFGCIMYCFFACFQNFVRGECHADERILQIEKESPVMPELRLSRVVEPCRKCSMHVAADVSQRPCSPVWIVKRVRKYAGASGKTHTSPCRFFKKGA